MRRRQWRCICLVATLMVLGIVVALGPLTAPAASVVPTYATLNGVSPADRLDPSAGVRDQRHSGPQTMVTYATVKPLHNDLLIKGKQRGGSGALVTGDGFRLAADYRFDETMDDGEQVVASMCAAAKSVPPMRPPPTVFVQTHMLDAFLHVWLPLGSACRIQLITHNSDYSSPYEASNTRWKGGVSTAYTRHTHDVLNNENVVAWYAQNAVVVHRKLQPIPIGIENRYNRYGAHYEVYDEVSRMASPVTERKQLLFVSFNVKTNPRERNDALRAAKSMPDGVTFFSGAPPKKALPSAYRTALRDFLVLMSQHQYVLAPHGHGVDTHRLWEALYVGCIPIVLRSPMDTLLEQLPVLIVDSYTQVNAAFLQAHVAMLSGRFELAKRTALNMSYWATRMRTATTDHALEHPLL